MTATTGTRRVIAHLAAMVLIAFAATLFVEFTAPSQAEAQSNVRPPAGAAITDRQVQDRVPGGALGNNSDSETWRKVRQGISGTVSIPDKKAGQLVQSEGDAWRAYRNGPLSTYGAWALLGVVVVLALFYLIRGKIKVDHGLSGKTVTRFADLERIGHWLLAVSFIILALTGLNITYGKYFLLPVIGKSAFAAITYAGKLLHNYVAFAFMAGLVMTLVLWIKHNFPNAHDFKWLAQCGGMLSKGIHPPAKKFNAGQKILFWLVIWGGLGLSVTGIALLFPFQIDLPAGMEPIQQMQFMTTWHAIIALALIVVVIAHIYIGTVGMQGAFDAMGSGEVDVNWAKEHHSIWMQEMDKSSGKKKKKKKGGAQPAAAE